MNMQLEKGRDSLNNEMARLGKALVLQFFILLKTSSNYSEGHAALDLPLANLLKVLREITRRNEDASLRLRGGHLYLGELRLKPDIANFEAPRHVIEEMKRHLLGRLSFMPEVTVDDLRRFVYALREVDAAQLPDVYTSLLDGMQQRMVGHIEVEVLRDGEVLIPDSVRLQENNLKARPLYKKVLAAMDEVAAQVAAGRGLRLRESKRVVQQIIDLLFSHESDLLGLSTMRSHDRSSQHHAANVCILSLVMGKRLGMSKFHLCELGLAALFHDLGKADVPKEILDKPSALTREERRIMENHVLYGVKKVMKLKGFDALSSRIITGIFEHHLQADFSGYPRFPYQRLSLFGRIINIADCYDGLTSSRVCGRNAYPPHKALRVMLAQAGTVYDQPLLKLFINCIGIHAIGSLLLLDSNELAVVVGNSADPTQWDNPRVRIIADAQGHEVEGEIIDLGLPSCFRTISATLDPYLYDLDVSRYFY
ncbi:cyclic diguanylate phosphodiesterase [Geoanaerobacter pelophilus]|uniref:Cyclic diguanylate phosphodiesterase n=2 Tax=Geoanaerobacter pelophilus TaxID=60036 RepID=A0ABQ0MLV2_9BACT|nr:cyclic diguanylate phosphodiesterase [Geoanaerobacter pelophilus]